MTRKAVILVSGMLMDLVSPLFPSAFVLVVCLGSLSRSFSKYMFSLIAQSEDLLTASSQLFIFVFPTL